MSTVDQAPPSPEHTGDRPEFETLLVELSTRFINLPPGGVDREIEDALRRVCEFLDIDFSVLWQWPDAGRALLVPTHGYPPLTEQQRSVPLQQEDYPWVVGQIREGRAVALATLDDLPDAAVVDRQSASRAGIRSNLTLPLLVGGEGAIGALAFNSLSRERDWPDPLVNRLKLAAQIFTNALTRKRHDLALRLSEARLTSAADLAGLAFYEIDYATGSAYFDDRFRDVCGLPHDHGPGLATVQFWLEHLHPDDRSSVEEGRERLHDGRLDRFSHEYRFHHPSRGERWIQHFARVATRDATGRAAKTVGVLRDVTERRRSEEALRQSYAEIERLKDRLQAESDYLKAEIGVGQTDTGITGSSPAVKQVLRQVAQVAPTGSSVLVLGETGTGKELLARAIHMGSPRRGHVMVKVNCAAMPSGLVESELFGREKGAFTGSLARQVGRFEIADGSTVFLDEVGELSLEVQAKLLRVLEEGEFERLGSPRTIKVDVRVIAATNRDLAEEVRLGRFREDLYYRLNVFPIRMPPLRERSEDIPQLVWALLESCCSRMGKKITKVPRATMEALQRQSWPGNVRELRNVIEYGAIITTGQALQVRLPDGQAASGGPKTLTEIEREHILRTLEATRGRIKGPGGAAALLGLNPSTLYSRMKKLGLRLADKPAT